MAGAAWFGEVAAIVFGIVPLIGKLPVDERNRFLSRVFPRLFRLASMLVEVSLGAGAVLNYQLTGWRNLGIYFASARWTILFVGAALGLGMGLFHFIVEPKLEGRIQALVEADDRESMEKVTRFLQISPRIGFIILIVVMVLMMAFSRGWD